MKRFALIGVAGFVAPRHLKAIRDTGHILVAAMDLSDSVGVLDQYFPEAAFFTSTEALEQHLEALKKENKGIDYFSVCTPNHLHSSHVMTGLKQGADVICEKPLVLDPAHAEGLLQAEKESGKKIFNIVQLRHHPDILGLKHKQEAGAFSKKAEVELAYITPRGKWYHSSWKGDIRQSGGIATNIGVHFFDMLVWIFGDVQQMEVHWHDDHRAAGFLELEKARVRWFLSIREQDLPAGYAANGKKVYRSISVDGEKIEFSDGFADLHTRAYEAILSGTGFSVQDVLPSIALVHKIRGARPTEARAGMHPMLEKMKN